MPPKKKTIEDIKWIEMDVEEDGKVERQTVCSVSDAIVYLGVSPAAGITILDRNKIRRYSPGYGNVKYVRKSVLDELKRVRPVSD